MAQTLSVDDPLGVDIVSAIRSGDIARLQHLLAERPDLATARLIDTGRSENGRTLLHIAADWPGHFPNGAETVRVLVAAGADPNARFEGPHNETPLHWAASSDDIEVLDALIDAGAHIDAPGAVVAGGTPLTDATAFGQWNAARRLLARGAIAGMWEAAVMGLTERVAQCLADIPAPSSQDVTGAFWGACHGGQIATAQLLLAAGADATWLGWDDLTPLGAAERSGAVDVANWLRQLGT